MKKLLILLLILLTFGSLFSQDKSMEELMEMSLEELLNMDIVSASKYEQSYLEAPSAISVLTKQDIKYAPVHNIVELLQYVVGMDGYTKTYTDMDVAARGMAFDETSKMLVLIDGQAVNVVPYGGMQWPTLPITLEDIERIEIVRGTASSIYGADALVGIVNIITKSIEKTKSDFNASYGEGGTQHYYASYQKLISDNLKFRIRAGYKKTENLGNEETDNAKNVAPNFEIKDWAEIYLTSFKLNYSNNNVNFTSVGGYSFDVEGYNPSPGDASMDKSKKQTFYVNNILSYKHQDNDLVFRLGYRKLGQENERFDSNLGKYLFKYKVKKGDGLDLDAQYVVKSIENNNLIVGLSFVHFAASRDIANTPPYIYDETDNLWSVYAQDEFKTKLVNFTLGARYDKWESLDGVFSPKAVMNIKVIPNKLNLRLGYGTSFRRPAFDENFYFVRIGSAGWFKGAKVSATTADGTPINGDYAKPEKMEAFELGLRWQIADGFLVDVESFSQKIKDIIGYKIYEADSLGLNLGFENTGSNFYIKGIETEIKKYFNQKLYTFINYTYQDMEAEDAEGNKSSIVSAPRHKLNGGIRYLGKVGVDARFRYVSKVTYSEVPSVPVKDYFTFDLAISKKINDNLFVKLSAINLLNNEHYEYPLYTEITRKIITGFWFTF
ncbi:MAG: ligand-gated channel protein [Calditrichia bacterium]